MQRVNINHSSPLEALRKNPASPISGLLQKITDLESARDGMIATLHRCGYTKYELCAESLRFNGQNFALDQSGLEKLRNHLATATMHA